MQQLKHKYDRFMDEEEEGDLGSMSCSSDHDEDDDSSSSGRDGPSTASSDDGRDHGSLYDTSILMAQLPLKRGLSKFYDGKSQSFTSLANAKTLEDVAKADRSSCRKQKQQSRANVHTSVHSRAIAKAKTRPPSSGNGSSTCSSTLPAAKGRPPPLPPQRAS